MTKINKTLNLIKKLQNINLANIGIAEENVKVKITIPILELLGFDKVSDMDFEKNVRNKKADIAIILDNKVKIVVETKKLHENLDKHTEQALNYAWNFQVNWVVLTNGLEIRIYKSFIEGIIDYRDRLIFKTFLKELDKNIDSLSKFISKQNIKDEKNLINAAQSVKENITEKILISDLTACREKLFNDLFKQYNDRYKYDDKFKENIIKWAKKVNIDLTDPKLNEKLCKEGAYTLINRILFLRICEDRKYIKPKLDKDSLSMLKNMIEKSSSILKFAFQEISPRFIGLYLGPLFDNTFFDDIEWNESTILFTLERLSSHNFAEINRDIIGRTYEKHISDQERKDLGQFYTPDFIIETILNLTLNKTLKIKPLSEIKILDLACGSGGFLLKAYDILREEYLCKEYKKEVIHKEILKNNLYGIDINPFATQLTVMNLLLKDLENPSTEMNIVIGDSLDRRLDDSLEIDIDLSPVSKINNENYKFISLKSVIDEKPFDVIIGNPPYIRVQNLDENIKKVYKKLYQSAVGSYDIYILFLERAIELLKEDGLLGFIVSSKFLGSNYGLNIRKFIRENTIVEKIIDLRETNIFEEATTYPIILILRKINKKKDYFEYKKISNIKSIIDVKLLMNESKFKKISVNFLKDSKWIFPTKEESDVLFKLRDINMKLEDFTEYIFQGIITSADDIFVLEGKKSDLNFSYLYSRELNKKIEIESSILKNILKGKNIKRYYIEQPSLQIIFPYKKINNKYVLYNEKELYHDFGKTFEYLRESKELLTKRDKGKVKQSDWYGYSRPQNLDLFDKVKIITPFNAFENSFYLDKGKYYFTAGVAGGYGIILKEQYKNIYNYILAILNSKVTEFYIKKTSDALKGNFYSFEKRFIKDIPIIFRKGDKRMETLFELISILETNPNNKIEIIDKIDLIIFDIYKLEDKYIDIIKNC